MLFRSVVSAEHGEMLDALLEPLEDALSALDFSASAKMCKGLIETIEAQAA